MSEHFDRRAVAKIKDRMRKARQSLYRAKKSKDHEDFYSAWSDFLIHTGNVVHALERGAEASSQARQKHGQWRKRFKADDLFVYMVQARNAEEHRLEDTTKQVAAHIAIGGPGESVHIKHLVTGPEFYRQPFEYIQGRVVNADTGETPSVAIDEGGPRLLPVENRGRTYPPPEHHDGQPLPKHPIEIGRTYLEFLGSAFAEISQPPR